MRKIFILMLSVVLLGVSYASAELNWGANVETNTTFEADSNGTETTTYTNDGRVEVVVESKTENESGMYVAGKGCFEVQVNGDVGVCDVYFQLGKPTWSFKVGHWEAESLFSKGQDIYIPSTDASQWYEANKARGRSPDGMGVVIAAGENLKFDVKASYDNDDDNNQVGIRPVLVFSSGSLTVKAGGEYLMETPQDNNADDENTWFGVGVDLSVALGNLTIGGSATYGKNDVTEVADDGTKTDWEEKVTSGTAYLKIKMGDSVIGVGAGYTKEDEADTNEMYAYASYDMPLPVEGAAVKFGAGFASGDDGSEDITAYGARVRFWYGF